MLCDGLMRRRRRARASLSMRGHIFEQTQGAGQRTASMPRGLAAAFIVFAFIVFRLVQQQGLLQQQLYAAAAAQTTR